MHQTKKGPEKGAEILTQLIPPEQWAVYAPVLVEGIRRNIGFAVGGGLAISAYSGYLRNTKDMDLFVREEDSAALLEMLLQLGFEEYTEFPYDPTWSFRSCRQKVIVDVLWKSLNGKVSVNKQWLTDGWELTVRETQVRLIPVEELIATKIYIMKRDRTDWPDILNLLYARGSEIRWEHLFGLLGDDHLLLGGVMNVFRWLCPGRATLFPPEIWARVGLLPPSPSDFQMEKGRVALIAAEKWFPGGES